MSERQVVVIRTGPKKKTGRLRDAIVGILGFALLVASVLLVNILPDEEPIEPQYKASFTSGVAATIESQFSPTPLTPGETMTFDYPVDVANVYNVVITFTLADDMPASDPDRFAVQLESPNGTMFDFAAGGGGLETAAREHTGSSTPPFYRTALGANDGIPQVRATFNLKGVPSDYFFTTSDIFGDPITAELFEIQAALEDLHDDPATIGTWKVHVTMLSAGDCPEVGPTAPESQRGTECQADNAWAAQTQAEADYSDDPGNHVTVAGVDFSYFAVNRPELVT